MSERRGFWNWIFRRKTWKTVYSGKHWDLNHRNQGDLVIKWCIETGEEKARFYFGARSRKISPQDAAFIIFADSGRLVDNDGHGFGAQRTV